jgi:hypothetical protein
MLQIIVNIKEIGFAQGATIAGMNQHFFHSGRIAVQENLFNIIEISCC